MIRMVSTSDSSLKGTWFEPRHWQRLIAANTSYIDRFSEFESLQKKSSPQTSLKFQNQKLSCYNKEFRVSCIMTW